MELLELINGTLLGDACIKFDNYKYKKYFCYKLTSKDRKFIEWFKVLFQKFNIACWITPDNKVANTFALYFYINSCPYSKELLSLRNKWYKKINGKTIKVVPRDLKLTPTTLLFWYLGDGSLIRRKKNLSRIPFIVLATNNFLEEDIEFLIKKLQKFGLNFYPVKYKSGFTGNPCGYCLYSSTKDGTPFRFFQLIGFECPKEIAECITGRKGKYGEIKHFKDKWPNEEDWIKILSNVKIGRILRKRRFELGLTQEQLAKKVGIRRENIRDVELEKRNFSVANFRKILDVLNIEISYILERVAE